MRQDEGNGATATGGIVEATVPIAGRWSALASGSAASLGRGGESASGSAGILWQAGSRLEVQAEGVVRVMHPSAGMGIEFLSRTPEQREHVHKFIDFLSSRPGTTPELQVLPGTSAVAELAEPSDGEKLEDPLLDLLHNHESLSQEEFLGELQKQRGSIEVYS